MEKFSAKALYPFYFKKGAFDESFYLELWLAGLTGLAEATQACSSAQYQTEGGKQTSDVPKSKHNCTLKTVTDQLLWKTLVLVKVSASPM
jgi:hypothetical protein